MIVEDPLYIAPTDNDPRKLWRYMDFTKFASLLGTKQLFFTRLDKFRDTFEGSYPINNFNGVPITNLDDGSTSLAEGQTLDSINEMTSLYVEKLKTVAAVSCWHLNDYESAAMWDLYLKSNEGVAIQSSYESIINGFKDTEGVLTAGKVEYIDFEKGKIPVENMGNSMMFKRKSFEHEKEFRIVNIEPLDSEIAGHGKAISVDINSLIEAVYVAPNSPQWIYDLVKLTMEKYEVNKPLIQSRLYDLPR
jgi:hypothetical protein